MGGCPATCEKSYGIVKVSCRGTELLRASLAAGHGVMLAPNHCRPCDPMVIGILAGEAGCLLNIMASWHLFKQGRLQSWLLSRTGASASTGRAWTAKRSLRDADPVEARRPLVIFPEGAISRHNDRLNYLMEGTAFIARTAAKKRAAASPPGRVVVHPVALRYALEDELEPAVTPVLEAIERRMAWRPQHGLPLVERVLKVGSAMLALKEIEYLGAPQEGAIGERVARLVDRLLVPLEGNGSRGGGNRTRSGG